MSCTYSSEDANGISRGNAEILQPAVNLQAPDAAADIALSDAAATSPAERQCCSGVKLLPVPNSQLIAIESVNTEEFSLEEDDSA